MLLWKGLAATAVANAVLKSCSVRKSLVADNNEIGKLESNHYNSRLTLSCVPSDSRRSPSRTSSPGDPIAFSEPNPKSLHCPVSANCAKLQTEGEPRIRWVGLQPPRQPHEPVRCRVQRVPAGPSVAPVGPAIRLPDHGDPQ